MCRSAWRVEEGSVRATQVLYRGGGQTFYPTVCKVSFVELRLLVGGRVGGWRPVCRRNTKQKSLVPPSKHAFY